MLNVRLNYDTNKFQRKGSLNPFLVSQLQSGKENPCYIKLTQGKFAIVDTEDYDELSKHKWYANKWKHIWYAKRGIREDSHLKTLLMHRVIMNAQKGQEVDHRNGDGLYNLRCNLRFCANGQNQYNQRPQKNRTSKFKGVCLSKGGKKWISQITLKSKRYYLGVFINEIDAALAYDAKAKELFGEFARLNFNSQKLSKEVKKCK